MRCASAGAVGRHALRANAGPSHRPDPCWECNRRHCGGVSPSAKQHASILYRVHRRRRPCHVASLQISFKEHPPRMPFACRTGPCACRILRRCRVTLSTEFRIPPELGAQLVDDKGSACACRVASVRSSSGEPSALRSSSSCVQAILVGSSAESVSATPTTTSMGRMSTPCSSTWPNPRRFEIAWRASLSKVQLGRVGVGARRAPSRKHQHGVPMPPRVLLLQGRNKVFARWACRVPAGRRALTRRPEQVCGKQRAIRIVLWGAGSGRRERLAANGANRCGSRRCQRVRPVPRSMLGRSPARPRPSLRAPCRHCLQGAALRSAALTACCATKAGADLRAVIFKPPHRDAGPIPNNCDTDASGLAASAMTKMARK